MEAISSVEELEALYGSPYGGSLTKVLNERGARERYSHCDRRRLGDSSLSLWKKSTSSAQKR